jgi:transketolase
MNKSLVRDLNSRCIRIRREIIEEVHCGGSGHIGGALSCVEILATLYFAILNLRPDEPGWSGRDRFILSKGHAAPALYAVLAERGFFPTDELKTFTLSGTRLQKHLDMNRVPGIDVSSGSLGQGLSIAIGMALADRMDCNPRHTYCLIGDGESQEGQVWEATLAGAHFKLDRLIVFLDNNHMQVDGFTQDIMKLEPVVSKWESFGWNVQRIDGHDIEQIMRATQQAKRTQSKPHVIVCDTVKGKGIHFMENRVEWHSHPIYDEEYLKAMQDLDRLEKEFSSGEK